MTVGNFFQPISKQKAVPSCDITDPNCATKDAEYDRIAFFPTWAASSSRQGAIMQVTEVTAKYINSILVPQILVQIKPPLCTNT